MTKDFIIIIITTAGEPDQISPCTGVSGRDGGDGDGEGRGDQGHCWGDQRKGLFLSKQNDGKVFCKTNHRKELLLTHLTTASLPSICPCTKTDIENLVDERILSKCSRLTLLFRLEVWKRSKRRRRGRRREKAVHCAARNEKRAYSKRIQNPAVALSEHFVRLICISNIRCLPHSCRVAESQTLEPKFTQRKTSFGTQIEQNWQ